ncbi:MAG: TonB-dependent receptor [Caulobacterales bacterium]|nr:TonB-dependent receptor [Caulobacterales bacterium]
MRTLLFTTAALTALTALPARAETSVDELIVTATRLPTEAAAITGVHVIDRAEIEARNLTFATDLLSTVPGVGIARTGAFGGAAAIRIRGASPDKTLVLVDGVPVDDPSDPNGAYDASSLQTTDLERIEVLNGPQSSLWGSDAIGGVVSFTTRELDGVRAEAEGGSFTSFRGFAGAGVKTDRYGFSANVAGFRTDGISKADTGTERDGFRTWTANANGRVTLSDAVKLDGRLRYTRSTVDLDGFAPPTFALGDTPDSSKSRAWQGFGRATIEALGLTHELSVNAYDIHRDNRSSFPSSFDADRQVYRWTATRGELFEVGAEHQRTSADLSSGKSLDLSDTAVFGVAHVKLQRLTLTGSARYDDPKAYKSKATARASAAVDLGAGFSAVASAGTGFKTPTISEAVCDFCFAPAVPLKPERSEGYDLRLRWANDRVEASVTAYRLLVRDQISYVASRYINIAKTSSAGVEASLDARLTDALRLKLGYAYLDAIDRSTTRSLLRVPDHSGSAALFWAQGPWEGAVTVRGESSQSDTARDGFSRAVRPGFVTADVAGAYAVNDRLSLTARVENLTDKRFEEVLGYREPGLAAYVGVRFRN